VKKKVKKEAKAIKEIPNPIKELITEKEHQFDFGGIPKRDLKKNLGCG
jgi:hypothetical protein